jgi:4-hydroxy-4-methyl-2-oxoglutarate aldolase
MGEKELTGKVAREAIVSLDIERYSSDVIDGFKGLEDLTGTVSDAMDEMGLAGVVPS